MLITGLILNSRWIGWKLALGLSFAYYGTVTFVMQIETWYFLSDLTVGAELLPRLFIMGIPVALFFILLAGLIFSIPQNLSHILENPLLPIASVRFSHMIETVASTFIFGIIVVGCYTESINHLRDLFGR